MNASNFIHITGNVGGTVRSNTLPSGMRVAEFSLATNDYYRDREGNRVQRTEWHRVKAFGKVAGVLAEHAGKGTQLSVVGTMRYRSYVNKLEQQCTVAEVYLDSFNFVGKKHRAAADAPTREELSVLDAN